MSAQTILLDLSIEPSRISDDVGLKDVIKLLEKGLAKYFPQLKLIFQTCTSDGHLCIFSQNNTIFLNIRFFNHGIITINIEYYKDDVEQSLITFDVSMLLYIPSFRAKDTDFIVYNKRRKRRRRRSRRIEKNI